MSVASRYIVEDQVFELVKSLTGQEKKYFIAYTSYRDTGADKNYLRLYRLMLSANSADYDVWKHELGIKNEANFRQTKSYLFQTLLASLRNFRQASPRMQIHDYLSNVEILFLRNMHSAALHELQKAKNIADEYEFFEENTVIAEWATKLYLTAEQTDRALEWADCLRKNTIQISHLQKLKLIYIDVFKTFNAKGYPRSEADANAYNALLAEYEKIKTAHAEPGPVRQRFLAAAIKSILLRIMGNEAGSTRYMFGLPDLLQAHPNIALSTPAYILPVFKFHLQQVAETGSVDAFRTLVSKIKGLHFLSERNNIRLKMIVLMAELNFAVALNDMEGQKLTADEAMPLLEKEGNVFGTEPYISLIFSFLITGKPDHALRLLNKLYHPVFKKELKDKDIYLRLLELPIHYDLGNFDILTAGAGNAGKLMRRKNRLYKIESLLLKYLVKSAHKITQKERMQVLKELYDKLNNNPDFTSIEVNFFKHVELKTWLSRKIYD